ncbi:putative protein kinase [Paratrimastix pyriformis]|uniref:Protein kinase domain-containing protein n=1 Tax=Paratrimastix pyriformis TaxID=342808 RepID=A0ABQ8UKR7_9EUKA|nr:putative protein kinase [Paratrimastix pyriformis]
MRENQARTLGGAAHLTATGVDLDGTGFEGNSAQAGGALFLSGAAQVAVVGCRFEGNQASTSGGGAVAGEAAGDQEASFQGCLFAANMARPVGTAVFVSSEEPCAARWHFADTVFRGQAALPTDTVAPGAVALQRIGGADFTNVTFAANRGGALNLNASEALVGPGCRFEENLAASERPVNAWATLAGLEVTRPDQINDTTLAGGALWLYTDEATRVTLPGPANLLPEMRGLLVDGGRALAEASCQTPCLSLTVRLADPRADARFKARCLLLDTEGRLVQEPVAFAISNASDPVGTCALDRALYSVPATYVLWLSNDGIHRVPVGTVHVFRSLAEPLGYALGPVGGLLLMAIVGLGCYALARWVRLKRATAIELASWRSYQVASVDFTSLKILQRVGHGAAGEVFKGDLNGTAVAVKRLFDTSPSQAMTDDFRREVAMMRTLRHPYIVSLIGATFESPRLIITEFMGRGSLYGLLHDEALAMPPALRLRMAFDMARAPTSRPPPSYHPMLRAIVPPACPCPASAFRTMRHAHLGGGLRGGGWGWVTGLNYLHTLKPPILHRDVKSQNMLVTDDLRVKVSDFGISRLSQEAGITTAAGTPAWSAPEVLRGDRSWLPSDVFSFGVVLWELFTRQTPWEGVPPLRVMMTVTQGARLPVPPPPAAAGEPGCQPLVGDLIRACFEERPEARPTMQQVRPAVGPPATHRESFVAVQPRGIALRSPNSPVNWVVDLLAPEVEAHPYAVAAEAPAGERRRRRKSPVPDDTERRAESVPLLEEGRKNSATILPQLVMKFSWIKMSI